MGRRKGDDENIVAERVNMVYALQLMGKRNKEIVSYIAKKYDIGERTVYNYIRKAKEQKDEDAKEYRDVALTEQVSQLRNLYEKNYKIQDFKECRGVLGQMSLLLGLNQPIKTESKIEHIEVNFED
jgi:transposase-like protein